MTSNGNTLSSEKCNTDNTSVIVFNTSIGTGDIINTNYCNISVCENRRKNKVIIPRSNFIFKKDDTVVLLAKRDLLPVVENMFRISSV